MSVSPITTNRRRRGVSRASITKLRARLGELEATATLPDTVGLAKRLSTRLQALTADFKTYHYAVVELLDTEDDIQREQDILDEHDEEVAQLDIRIDKLISSGSSPEREQATLVEKSLKHLEKSLTTLLGKVSAFPLDGDICLLQQYDAQVTELKKELSDTRRELLSLKTDDRDLNGLLSRVEEALFDCSLKVRKLLHSHSPSSTSSDSDMKGVKLPKLEVPTFDGNILEWTTFWEQFKISVHDRVNLTDSEKLAYLRHALKGGTAKSVIEGLSRSGEHYSEAISCLKSRYSKPRLIHQAHVRKIIETPNLKDGSGKELRRLHNAAQQHLRALKAMGHEPSGSFITSMLELKLDVDTMFEWQRQSQDKTDVPHYQDLLKFLDLRAQASEAAVTDSGRRSAKQDSSQARRSVNSSVKPVASHVANATTSKNCVVCKTEKHPLFSCPKFKNMSHSEKTSIVKFNHFCINCLRPGHFVKDCSSVYHCRACQKPHHTLLHIDGSNAIPTEGTTASAPAPISTNAMMGIKSDHLLMTCRVVVEHCSNGSVVEARAILDPGSSASFISERLAQSLCLPRTNQNTRISGVAGLTQTSSQPITSFKISSTHKSDSKLDVIAVIVSRVTSDLPLQHITSSPDWNHISSLKLADPKFGVPGRIDLLLGVEVFAQVVLHGRRFGPPGSPMALETRFGWVLAGSTSPPLIGDIVTHHATMITGDELLYRFWKIEETTQERTLTSEDRLVMSHFKDNHERLENGRFLVPLPKKPDAKPLGESRCQVVRRFLSFERSLHSKGHFSEFKAVIDEYFDQGHAESVPVEDLDKPVQSVFYMPMHTVTKDSSTTTKIRAVFDASMKTSSGVSLNDTLCTGPTVHSSLVDVLLRFRCHRVALITDVSRMYRAVALSPLDKDLHRFVWRNSTSDPLQDFRMTRVTFGVSVSSFVANMCVKQNAHDHALAFPLAAQAVENSFYVDDGLTGADSIAEAIDLHHQLQALFGKAQFLLRKWNSSEPVVVEHIDPELRDQQSVITISDCNEYTKTLGVEWNSNLDHFRLTIANYPTGQLTKRALASDIAKIFDALGWVAPVTIKAKILLQQLWEEGVGWDEEVPAALQQEWQKWRRELVLLKDKHIPRCYYPKEVKIVYQQIHGFSDASEQAYAGVVYLRQVDTSGQIHIALIVAKTKVAPIKRLSIPRLELCGALLLARLLRHCQDIFMLKSEDLFAWTDSTIVLNWLHGSPRRFKTFVGNRVTLITELVESSHWHHVDGSDNPADCASRGLLPSELLTHNLWWDGPTWLCQGIHCWPMAMEVSPNNPIDEAEEIRCHVVTVAADPIISLDKHSSFTLLVRTTARVLRFIHNCRSPDKLSGCLSVSEIEEASRYWIKQSQSSHFASELKALKDGNPLQRSSSVLNLNPFIDCNGVLRVGGRQRNSKLKFCTRHPAILHGKHPVSKLLIRTEHIRLLHAGPTLISASLGRRYFFIKGRQTIRSITRSCVTCRKKSAHPQLPLMGQLPMERVTPDLVFSRVGVDYAGPLLIKLGHTRKPTVVKVYVAVFVSLSVKAVHLELVSDLTSEAFIACLRRFIARRGRPVLMWSDHGTNFVGAKRLLKDFYKFLQRQTSEDTISDFCSSQGIQWEFTPERAPHFGGLWEAAVKSFKYHLFRVMGNTKLTFEELYTVVVQVEACLNSRPLTALPTEDDGEVEALTPGHFLVGRPLQALPDPESSYHCDSLLKRWDLCQKLTRHFWQRWCSEYLQCLQRLSKWRSQTAPLAVGDVVILREDGLAPARWSLARIVDVHPGKDGIVRVVTVKTGSGSIFTRPAVKVAKLLT